MVSEESKQDIEKTKGEESKFLIAHPGLKGRIHSMLLTGCGGRDFGKHFVVRISYVDETQLDKEIVKKAIEDATSLLEAKDGVVYEIIRPEVLLKELKLCGD